MIPTRRILHLLRRALTVAAVIVATVAHFAGAQATDFGTAQPADVAESAQAAQRELEHARAAVAEARAAAIAAKADLEAAVAAPAHELSAEGHSAADDSQDEAAGSESPQPANNSVLADATAAEIEILEKLVADLKLERRELLEHLTSEHPLVVDTDLRLAEYEEQLAGLTRGRPERGAESIEPPSAENALPDASQLTERRDDAQRRKAASLRLAQSLANWEVAQHGLQSAIDAEAAAANRLSTLASQQAHQRAVQEADVPLATIAPTTLTADTAADSFVVPPAEPQTPKGSQSLVLAALIIALVIAAIASVKLARATDETIFAGADDAASDLALPVIGVIPAPSVTLAHGTVFATIAP